MLVNISANEDLTLTEYHEAASYIEEAARGPNGEDPEIIVAVSLDESCGDEIRITVIATGIECNATAAPAQEEGTLITKPAAPAPVEPEPEKPQFGGGRRSAQAILDRQRQNGEPDDYDRPAYLRYSDRASQYKTSESFTIEEDDDAAFLNNLR